MVCSNVKRLMGMLSYHQVFGHKPKLEKLNILISWWMSAKSVYDNSDCRYPFRFWNQVGTELCVPECLYGLTKYLVRHSSQD